jgi:hypothetical protein
MEEKNQKLKEDLLSLLCRFFCFERVDEFTGKNKGKVKRSSSEVLRACQSDSRTVRQLNSRTETEIDREIKTRAGRQRDRGHDRLTDIQTYGRTGGWTDIPTNRQTGKQAGR